MDNYDYISIQLMLPRHESVTKMPFITNSFNGQRDFYVIQENGYIYEDISEKSIQHKRRYLSDFNGTIEFRDRVSGNIAAYAAEFIDGKLHKISLIMGFEDDK